MRKPEKYEIELYYAFVETGEGIYHTFETVDPAACTDDDEVAKRLAGILHTDPDDDSFRCSSVLLPVPKAVIDAIRHDMLKECAAAQERPGHGILP